MTDAPFSVRIEQETRDKLGSMIEQSGLSAKDFVARLLASYEANQARDSLDQITELEPLRHHLARIEEIYIAMVKTSQDKASADALKIAELEESIRATKAIATDEREAASRAIKEAQGQVETARGEAALIREATEKELASMREALGRAQESQEQAARLATLAEKAARDAEERATHLEAQANLAGELQQRLNALTNEYNDLTRRLTQSEDTIAQLKELIEAEKRARAEELAKALGDAAKTADIDKREALLEARNATLSEISNLREQLAQAREEKAALEIRLATNNR